MVLERRWRRGISWGERRSPQENEREKDCLGEVCMTGCMGEGLPRRTNAYPPYYQGLEGPPPDRSYRHNHIVSLSAGLPLCKVGLRTTLPRHFPAVVMLWCNTILQIVCAFPFAHCRSYSGSQFSAAISLTSMLLFNVPKSISITRQCSLQLEDRGRPAMLWDAGSSCRA
jgi:hypothetical protein